MSTLRPDHLAIAARVPDGARVIDVGCGDGALLAHLRDTKGADARGLELDTRDAGLAIAKGLSVVQGDAGRDLEIFPDHAFDVAILSMAIQEMLRPAHVLAELTRIAPDVIVSFRNYGQWQRRLHLLMTGRMPSFGAWHDEDALHPCTCADMLALGRETGLAVKSAAAVSGSRVGPFRTGGLGGLNWRADEVIVHFTRA